MKTDQVLLEGRHVAGVKQIDAANFSPLVTSSDAANPPRVISIYYFEMLAPFYAVLVHSLVECELM